MNYENIYNQIIVKRQKEILVKQHKLDLDYQYCEAHKHPYSHERKLKQTMTIIKNCYSHLCDFSEFNFELYINLSNYNKRKYRQQYIKTHQKTVQ